MDQHSQKDVIGEPDRSELEPPSPTLQRVSWLTLAIVGAVVFGALGTLMALVADQWFEAPMASLLVLLFLGAVVGGTSWDSLERRARSTGHAPRYIVTTVVLAGIMIWAIILGIAGVGEGAKQQEGNRLGNVFTQGILGITCGAIFGSLGGWITGLIAKVIVTRQNWSAK